jgi:multidrug efflux pump subunit AcrA (membrane-fusion protein)
VDSEPNVQAEILKLARLLHCPPERLSYLEDVPASDVRELREQATDMLFSAHDKTLEKLAASSKLLPVGLNALIAERAFGPLLTARMAGLIEPARAVATAERLSPQFLAETAGEIDPRRASEVIASIGAEQIAKIARVLVDRKDYVTMGQAVGQLSPEALKSALSELSDEDLLRTAFVAENKDRLPELAELLGRERLLGLIDVAEQAGLQEEATDLLGRLDEAQRSDLLEAIRERDEESHRQVLERLANPLAG